MQSSGRPNFWIPPDSTFESAVPSPTTTTGPPEPPTPTRGNTRFNRPPLPLPSPQRQTYRQPPPPPQSIRHNNDRTGKEFNRRERRFENIFDQWSQEVARLQEEHRAVSLKCRNEEESTIAMDNFNRKVQAVMTRYNEEIEALQMSSSEPPSSQSENEEEEDSPAPTPSRNHSFHLQNDGSNDDDDEEDEGEEDEETSEEDGEEDEDDVDHRVGDPPEHALDDDDDDEEDEEDEERASTPLSEALNVDMSSGDDTDHSARLSRRSVKSYQSSEVSHGSLNLNTPPPTEVDEDHRATRRRHARERRKTDELASALPLRLRSETLRGVSPLSATTVPRPAAMSLFENLSSSPASISSMPGQPLGSPYSSRRPSRDVPTTRPSPVDINPAAVASRIDYLRRQNSTSGSDRSLSRNRASSPADERTLFKDQFESWKTSIQNQSETLLKNAEKQTEDVKRKFLLEQEEKHQRAQLIFIAEQERLLQSFSRNRAGSTGSTAASGSPAVGSHPRSGSFAMPHAHGIAPSISPTLQRGVPSPAPPSSSPAGRPLHSSVSQTFHYASGLSQSPPQQSSSRAWVPKTAPVATQPENRHSTASSSGSDEIEGVVEEEEEEGQQTYKGTPPISIPNSARGSFDMGHRRTSSQVYSGTSGASSTPRNPFPQHLRNSSSTTFSSNGTASARSSGGWSGASGASTNTTVTSSDTPGSRRGSVGEKTFVPPTGLHGESRKNVNGLTVGTSPPNQQPRWLHGSIVGSVDAPGSATHSPASTFSRASGNAAAAAMNAISSVNIPPRATAQQWHTAASASSPSAASAVPPIPNSSSIGPGSLPRSNPVGPLNIGQSPGKSSWKSTATGKPSPPIPIQTRPPSGSTSSAQRNWSDASFGSGSFSTATPPLPFGSARASPSLRGSMSNADLVSTTETHTALKSRPSTSTFAIRDRSLGRPSRSKSPKKPVIIPAKAAPSPAKISSSPPEQPLSDHSVSSPEPEPQPEMAVSRREGKQKVEPSRRAKKEAADHRKRQEDLARREEELKRREAELERELERQREEEDLSRREAELRKREEELKRQEAEVRRRKHAEAEAKLKRQKEAEEESKRKKDAELKRQKELELKRQKEAELKRQKEAELKRQQEAEEARRLQEEAEAEAEAERLREAEAEAEAEAERLREEAEAEAERQHEEARRKEEEERQARRNLEESERRSHHAPKESKKKGTKKRGKPSVDEQKELEAATAAARERERLAEEERQMQEAIRIEREAYEEAERQEQARLAAERREAARLDEERLEAERREQRKQELYRQEQDALEEARQRQRAKEEKRLAEERRHMRQEDERRNAWSRQQEEERKLEEERRAQEARIREQNDRMTEMFQARDRSNQMTSNMPKRFADAWEAYDEKWKRLISQAQTGGRPALTFATVPWPLLNPPSGPDAITRNAVGAFVLSQWHSKGKSPRDRIRDALLRWHPDRFESRYLGWAPEGEERENVKIGVGNVTRSLNELLTKEGPGAAL